MPVTICVAGATGATGRAVAEGVLRAPDLVLYSSVARSAAGLDLGEAWGQQGIGVPVFGQVVDALDGVDVLVDYTSYASIRTHDPTAGEARSYARDAFQLELLSLAIIKHLSS